MTGQYREVRLTTLDQMCDRVKTVIFLKPERAILTPSIDISPDKKLIADSPDQ